MTDSPLPCTMSGVLLTGHGGLDRLQYRRDLPVPRPGPGEVLIRIGAAGINNTDINTRIAWYSKEVSQATSAGGDIGFEGLSGADGTWSGTPLQFPRIQGADGCGEILAVGERVDPKRVGERVLVRPMQDPLTADGSHLITWGSECDGAFAEYALCRASEAYKIDSPLSDAELASFPCAYSTAENMLHRARVRAGERVLITGASGGVGCAAMQLAVRRGAEVWAVTSAHKGPALLKLGAAGIICREQPLAEQLEGNSLDVVVDLVAGPEFATLLEGLKPGGRYAVAGAIAGPLVELDVRTLYLKDLTLLGCTAQPREVFENLLRYIEAGELLPQVANTYPLSEIHQAQEAFLSKQHVGKLVLIP
ncbi:alcohol dehydrogenase family protein [Ferrimonas sp. YFM]|uniref:alcohol dehydrogenase family protein n=1 Tax=Ferrimonas sp. YFM TaxID=3028878 RepID=UPI0025739166|nr:alcohol dehydrogenase family protein [Ferrimonas sp. YFM]BDY06258.1 alcohol dehydrogenase [Ferrimonas sp. YFM]